MADHLFRTFRGIGARQRSSWRCSCSPCATPARALAAPRCPASAAVTVLPGLFRLPPRPPSAPPSLRRAPDVVGPRSRRSRPPFRARAPFRRRRRRSTPAPPLRPAHSGRLGAVHARASSPTPRAPPPVPNVATATGPCPNASAGPPASAGGSHGPAPSAPTGAAQPLRPGYGCRQRAVHGITRYPPRPGVGGPPVRCRPSDAPPQARRLARVTVARGGRDGGRDDGTRPSPRPAGGGDPSRCSPRAARPGSSGAAAPRQSGDRSTGGPTATVERVAAGWSRGCGRRCRQRSGGRNRRGPARPRRRLSYASHCYRASLR